jgi:hypothetical protein
MHSKIFAATLIFLAAATTMARAETSEAVRNATREQVRAVLETAGTRSDVNMTFRQSTKNPYNFIASATGLTNCDSLEVVVSVTKSDTIGFRIYPHYHGGYINIGRAKDSVGLMNKLLYFSDQNFLFWGADDTSDVFSGFTITLESGFPREVIVVVLRSIRNTDGFVGQMSSFI